MKKAMKAILTTIKSETAKREYKKDEYGRVIIPMVVNDDSDFLSVYSETEAPIISTDIAEYIETKTDDIPADEQLTLRIRSNCIDAQEQQAYRTGVKEYYMSRFIYAEKELKQNTILAVILLVTGLIALFLMNLVDATFGSYYWTEVVDIIAWVFIWESVDTFVFGTHEYKTLRSRCVAYMDMNIEFLPIKNTVA